MPKINPRDAYRFESTGPEGTVCLMMVECGIGDDICALPAVTELSKTHSVTVYTHHKDLWEGRVSSVVGVAGDKVTCDNGEYLDPLWDVQHFPSFETIYQLSHWAGWEDDGQGFNSRSRFDQLAALLGVTLSEPFDFVAALHPEKKNGEPYTVLAFESNDWYRSLLEVDAKKLYDKIPGKVVWLTSGKIRYSNLSLMTKCNSFQELIDTVYNATRVVGVDSGIAHIAGALGIPLTAIGGMTDVKDIFSVYAAPLTTVQLPWSGCQSPCYRNFERGFSREKCCGVFTNARCMEHVNVDEVISLIQ